MPGSAPRADVWIVVEHPSGWGDAPLTRAEHGVRVLMARAARRGARAVAGFRVWVAYCAERPARLRVGLVGDPGEVAGWDLAQVAAGSARDWGRPDPEPLLLVCANGRRDRCCGHAGGRLADRLWAGPDASRILTCTHLGGHRFAPTALVLPNGVLHGRLDEGSASALLDLARAGRTTTSTLRGFSTLSEAGQVAEAEARRVTGYDRLDPLPVEVVEDAHDPRALACARARARVRIDGQEPFDVELARVIRAQVQSCGRVPEAVARWRVAHRIPD